VGHRFAELAFTPAVRAAQQARGSRASYARLEQGPPRNDRLGPEEAAFLEARDGFYLASVGEGGWPYVQFRGGPPGFVRVLDERTLAWADFRGNRQYVTVGNLAGDDRVALIAVDYAARRRLKILGRAELLEVGADDGLAARLAVPGYDARVERAVRVRIAAFDWNCPQHIPPRFTREEVEQAVRPLRERIAELEARLASCESRHPGDPRQAAGRPAFPP
jgi:predicted pyridoxine 5'-phosphate oxidase superfamily flavin-nucleotide-binding protein